MNNIFASIPDEFNEEIVEALLSKERFRIERILSKGQASPRRFWYDQDEHEWVMVLKGAAEIVFKDGRRIRLESGDYLDIPAHEKHRVSWTDPDQATVWLAVFYP